MMDSSDNRKTLMTTSPNAHQVIVCRTLRVKPDVSFELWIQSVFLDGGGLGKPIIDSIGVNDGSYLNCRRIVTLGIHEEITYVEKPSTIRYSIVQGPFPLSFHQGIVEFIPSTDGNMTEFKWTVNYIPNCWARLFLCGHYGMRAIISRSLNTMSTSLEHAALRRLDLSLQT